MFSSLWSAFGKPRFRQPQRLPARRRLCLESLEDRALPSGGGPGTVLGTTSGSGSSPGGPTAVISQSGSTPGGSGQGGGGSGSTGISGPGYPLAPAAGPTRPDVAVVGQPTQDVVLVPLSGSPGGPTFALVPMLVTVTGTGGTPGGSGTC
jgi:hypothetical protein